MLNARLTVSGNLIGEVGRAIGTVATLTTISVLSSGFVRMFHGIAYL